MLFEDNHILVWNKPAGVLTQPSGTEQESVEEQAKAWLKEKYQKPGAVFLHAIHRLDKPVSGVVLFAKTSKALSRLQASMRDKETRKLYWAWVEGQPKQPSAVLEHTLFHDEHHARVVPAGYPGGKLARLSYRTLEKKDGMTLLEITLETGRYHQIRAQLAAIGCPIVGDRRYGSTQTYLLDGIALHHRCLEITHPISKERVSFMASWLGSDL